VSLEYSDHSSYCDDMGIRALALAALLVAAFGVSFNRATASPPAADTARLQVLYKRLIDAENRHDLTAVRGMLWQSSAALFVAKTATPAEGNWAGFWGYEVVLEHLRDIYKHPFTIDPDYSKEKTVFIDRNVGETYVPVRIAVGYAGQTPVPKPFLMIIEWVRTPDNWRMATDIALPIPPTTT
jgi:hypothetical protein